MEDLIIIPNNSLYISPQVRFYAASGVCEISGESFMESVKDFYDTLMDWLRRYMKEVDGKLSLHIRLSYYNSSSSRCILDMLRLLKGYELQGHEVTVTWHLDTAEDYSVEDIEDFSINTGLHIHIVPTEPEQAL
jgi:hypothetical protein